MADLNTEIRIGADASGVETGVSKAKKSLASLGAAALQAGRDAAKGVGSIGDGGDKSAKQVESATKSIVSSLQRQIAAFEAGGRGTRQYQESLARLRGVDVNSLKPLLDHLDASKAKAQAAASANVQLTSSYAGLSGAALSAGRVLAAIGVGVSIREFIQLADASTNVASRLSLVTSSAAELVAVQRQLFTIAQSSRVSFVDLAQTYSQMSRATKELGVSQNDMLAITKTISQAVTISGGSAQSAQAALIQLSQGFAAGALRGEELNSIMEQTPRLAQAIANGMGVGIGKLREMGKAGELTAEAVLGALQKSAAAVEAEFASMTPTVEQSMTRITNSVLKLVGALDSVFKVTSAISTAFGYVVKALDFVSTDLEKINSQGALREAATQVQRLDQQATQLRNGMANGFYGRSTAADLARVNKELEVAKERFKELREESQRTSDPRGIDASDRKFKIGAEEIARQSKLANDLNNVRLKLSGVPESYVKDMKEIIRLNQAGVLVGKEYTDALKKQQESLDKKGASSAASAIKEEQNAYESLISSIRTKIESESLEIAGGNALTESQKIRIKLDQELASGKLKLSAAHRAVATAALEELAVLERRKLVASAEKTYDAERLKIAAEISAALVAEDKAREKSIQSVNDYAQAIDDQNAQTQFEVGLSGQSSAAREIAIRQRRIQLDLEKQIDAINDKNSGFDEAQRIEQRTRARAAAAKASAGAESAVYLEEWKKTTEAIESSITDALMRGFESGKGFAENLRDTVVNMFKTMVLRPVVQATVQGGMNAIGLGSAVGQGGGIMGMASNASSLYSLSNGLNSAGALGGLFASNAAYGAAIGTTSIGVGSQAAMLAAQTGAFGAAGVTATSSAAAGAGAGASSVLGAVPVYGWIALAALAAYSIFSKNEPDSINTGNATASFDNAGNMSAYQTNFGGSSKAVDQTLAALNQSYANTALALGIGRVDTQFATGGYGTPGKDDAHFRTFARGGSSTFDSGEVASTPEAMQLAVSRAVLAALKGSELPRYLTGIFESIEVSTASQEQISNVLAYAGALKALDATFQTLPMESLKALSYEAANGLITFSGGLEALSANLSSYYENFYSEEERRAQTVKNITATLAGAGLSLLEGDVSNASRAQFRAYAEAMDVTTEAGQRGYAALMSVAGAFAQITPEVKAVADATADLSKELAAAAADAAKRAAEIASTRAGMEIRLMELSGDAIGALAAQRAIELAGLDESLRGLQLEINARIDLNDATERTAAALSEATAAQEVATQSLKASRQEALALVSGAVDTAYAQVVRAADAQRKALTAVYDQQATDWRAQIDTVGMSMSKLQGLGGKLKSTLDGMSIAGGDGAARTSAQQTIAQLLATAKAGGGLPIDSRALDNALSAISQPSEQLFGSFTDYARDFYKTANDISALNDLTDKGLTEQQAMQSTLESQLAIAKASYESQISQLDAQLSAADAMANNTTAVLSMADALALLNVTLANLNGVRAAQGGGTGGGGTPMATGPLSAAERAEVAALTSYNAGANGTSQELEIYRLAAQKDLTAAQLDTKMGYAPGTAEEWIRANGLPMLEVGTNYVPKDGAYYLHQGEAVQPAAYNPAVGGSMKSDRLEALVESLIKEVAELRASAERGNENTGRAAKSLDGQQSQPLLVQVVA